MRRNSDLVDNIGDISLQITFAIRCRLFPYCLASVSYTHLHRFAERDDPETGEHWIDTDAHAMRAPSIAEDEPVQACLLYTSRCV